MKSPIPIFSVPRSDAFLLGLLCTLAALWPGMASSVTDLSNNPISSVQTAAAKPNIMLMLDAHDSMKATGMPDDLEKVNVDAQPIGYRSWQCNSMYFNPSVTYQLPKVVDTADPLMGLIDAPKPSFTSAPYNYYTPSILSPAGSPDVNLNTSFQAFDFQTRYGLGQSTTTAARSDRVQQAYYWLHSGGVPLAYNSAACSVAAPTNTNTSSVSVSGGGGTWTRTRVTTTSAQQANFAIWYTYYRTRMALVKTSVGLAFAGVANNYRVGFITVAPLLAGSASDPDVPPIAGSAVDPNKYQPIDDFGAAQRKKIYNKLYAQATGGASPSREALARVGRHYSDYGVKNVVGAGAAREDGINKGMPEDPVQHSCQRNYAIMLADGYWNKSFETVGAVKLDGVTKVGQQDSPFTGSGACDGTGNGTGTTQQCAPRPIYDGGVAGYFVDQQQAYDYQLAACIGNATQTVTNYTGGQYQYSMQTQAQYRASNAYNKEVTQTTQTTKTQTKNTAVLTETVTHLTQTVTQSIRRVTNSTQSTSTATSITTQVGRNDKQQTIQYLYKKKMVKTATLQTWAQTTSATQWQQVNRDGTTWSYVLNCSAETIGTTGCRASANAIAPNTAIDPGVDHLGTCIKQDPTAGAPPLGNNFLTVTCSTVSDSGPVAISPPTTCASNALKNDKSRQTCVATTTISYVSPNLCSAGTSNNQTVTCDPATVPTLLLPAPAQDANAACTAATAVTSNLDVPTDATPGTSNSYQVICPTPTTVPVAGATAISNTSPTQYAVDPATCTPAMSGTTSATGVTTTCKPNVVGPTQIPYDKCKDPVTLVAITCPGVDASDTNNWVATSYSYILGTASNVSRDTCPSTLTVGQSRTVVDPNSPYAQTVCKLVSDVSTPVNSTTCPAGSAATTSGGNSTTCATTLVTAATTVAPGSCTPGNSTFNPTTGYTTACDTVVDIQPHAVAACTYTTSPRNVGNSTYTCSTSTTLDIPVVPGTCSGGTSTDPVTGIVTTTTCNPVSVVNIYVAKDTCVNTTDPAAMTQVSCVAKTIGTSGAVTSCTPTPAGGTFVNGTYSATSTTIGLTTICTNNPSGWVQEAVNPALCTGTTFTPSGTKPTGVTSWTNFSGKTTTDANLVQTQCLIYDTGEVASTSVCVDGVTSGTNLTKTTCKVTEGAANAGAGPSCVQSATSSTTSTPWPRNSSNVRYYQSCTTTPGPITSVLAGDCTAAQTAAAAANPVTSVVSCAANTDAWFVQSRYTTSKYKTDMSGALAVGDGVLMASPVTTAWAPSTPDVGACSASPTLPPSALATAADGPLPLDLSQTSVDGTGGGTCTAWPCRQYFPGVDNGSQNSLADVAQYYYATDLRAGLENNISVSKTAGVEDDRATHQHMVTYVVGLGVSGSLAFDPSYLDSGNLGGDFPAIRAGKVVPTAIGATGLFNWPVWPTAAIEASSNPLDFTDKRSIDDFWHTAVNGRGRYFSASDASTMVTGIQGVLDGINANEGAGAGATPTTVAPTAADNTVFLTGFKTVSWTGDVQALIYDLATNTVIPSTVSGQTWSAQAELQKMVGASTDSRNIVFRLAGGVALGAGSNLSSFTYANLGATQKTYFDTSKVALLSQGGTASAAGDNLVNYLRGQRGREVGFTTTTTTGTTTTTTTTTTPDYRQRVAVLGDIVGFQPVFVKQPSFAYGDSGYDAFAHVGAAATRKKMVYVGANDGMLHAFYAPQPGDANLADGGKEAWAYVPSQMMPSMYKLADVQYSSKHQFFVDGTVTTGDVVCVAAICPSPTGWRTIVVGGFNAGGKGYYALDVTDPEAPKSLWEFTTANNANVGLSFGRPIITKLVNGTWTVMFTSGYNNADGKGYLYVVNALTGALIKTMTADSGADTGLREINDWVNNVAVDNTAQRIYGGDLQGNVWRFEVNDPLATAGLKLTTLTTGGTTPTPQPITARLELAEIGGDPYVFAGTGRLLGTADLTDTQLQSVYSFKDTNTAQGDLRSILKPMAMTGTLASGIRTADCVNKLDPLCSKKTGWVFDLPESGERMTLDFKAGKGTLVFVTNVPAGDVCSNGHSWLNYVDMVSGKQISSPGEASVLLDANSLGVGLGLVDVSGATGSGLKAIGVSANGQVAVKDIPFSTPPPVGKRISWREVVR